MLVASTAVILGAGRSRVPAPSDFAALIERLSEPAGNFDTDNLISNERSYLHVIPALEARPVTGGAYVGVGPDQNFSYIAAAHPSIAFIIDIRRDNLLLHLLFKALFQISDTRAEYLGHLFGRRLAGADRAGGGTLDALVQRLDTAEPLGSELALLNRRIDAAIDGFGVPLSAEDRVTIVQFHRRFVEAGLSLKFQSYGRPPRSYYPTYRELLLETDLDGRQRSFLATEAAYASVRDLERRDLVVPVVGDLAGPHALAAIGRTVRERGASISALYVSNVELYLFQDGRFPRFAETVSALPRTSRSLIIRSIFTGLGFWSRAAAKPGYASASVTQPIDDFVADYAARRYTSYPALLGGYR